MFYQIEGITAIDEIEMRDLSDQIKAFGTRVT